MPAPPKSSDPLIYIGCTVTQLMRIFGQDMRTVKGKIATVKPVTRVEGLDVWSLREVAPYLVKPVGDFEAAMRNMSHEDLPPNLRKEFWHAKRQEQAYRKEAGELWPTEDVLGAFAETFKTIRTELMLLGEAVEREMALSDRAREILKANIDATMVNTRAALITKFGAPDPDKPIKKPAKPKEVQGEDEFQGL